MSSKRKSEGRVIATIKKRGRQCLTVNGTSAMAISITPKRKAASLSRVAVATPLAGHKRSKNNYGLKALNVILFVPTTDPVTTACTLVSPSPVRTIRRKIKAIDPAIVASTRIVTRSQTKASAAATTLQEQATAPSSTSTFSAVAIATDGPSLNDDKIGSSNSNIDSASLSSDSSIPSLGLETEAEFYDLDNESSVLPVVPSDDSGDYQDDDDDDANELYDLDLALALSASLDDASPHGQQQQQEHQQLVPPERLSSSPAPSLASLSTDCSVSTEAPATDSTTAPAQTTTRKPVVPPKPSLWRNLLVKLGVVRSATRQLQLDYQEQYDNLQDDGRIQVGSVAGGTYQGRRVQENGWTVSDSTNGCAAISQLMVAHHMDPDYSWDPETIDDELVADVIDRECVPMLQALRAQHGLHKYQALEPWQANVYMVENGRLSANYEPMGGNIMNADHVKAYLAELTNPRHAKAGGTFYFKSHVISILRVTDPSTGQMTFDVIDSLPKYIGKTLSATRTHCTDVSSLEAFLLWHTTSSFSELNFQYMDDKAVPFQEHEEKDPRIFQGFVWSA